MISCMRSGFFIFFLLSSLTLLAPQFFAYMAVYLMLWKLAELEGWICPLVSRESIPDRPLICLYCPCHFEMALGVHHENINHKARQISIDSIINKKNSKLLPPSLS